MKKVAYLTILCFVLLLAGGCGGDKSVRQLPHLGDTPYQQDSVLVVYATNPERALILLDSALLLGNISEYRAQFIRAKIYSKSLEKQNPDSAIIICETLLSHDSVRNEPSEQENIYDMLIATSRVKHDDEAYLHWATQKATLCQQQGEDTERWRTEADIGLVMTFLGRVDEGLDKLDEAISHLDAPGSMDAFIVAVKREINALNELHRDAEVILLAQRILDRLDHYEQHSKDYAEDSYRLSWSDNPTDRDRYLDYCRAQAWAFMAQAYALNNERAKAEDYLLLFNQSGYGKTFMARRMIASTQMALGMYDEALTTYDEMECRMAGDTLNDDYAVILRSRAVAAYSKGHQAEAYDYQRRYANLSKALSDSLHASEAHDYAARYHAQEQQLMIHEQQAVAERLHIISVAIAVLALLAIVFALYFFRQKRVVTEKNRALVRMINEQSQQATPQPLPMKGEQQDIFISIDTTIRTERLYVNVGLQRQDICDKFSISRHALNDLLSQHTDGLSFPQYINNIRLEEALCLLRDNPEMTVSAIASEVGFMPANFREQFKRRYGVTPAEFQKLRKKM